MAGDTGHQVQLPVCISNGCCTSGNFLIRFLCSGDIAGDPLNCHHLTPTIIDGDIPLLNPDDLTIFSDIPENRIGIQAGFSSKIRESVIRVDNLPAKAGICIKLLRRIPGYCFDCRVCIDKVRFWEEIDSINDIPGILGKPAETLLTLPKRLFGLLPVQDAESQIAKCYEGIGIIFGIWILFICNGEDCRDPASIKYWYGEETLYLNMSLRTATLCRIFSIVLIDDHSSPCADDFTQKSRSIHSELSRGSWHPAGIHNLLGPGMDCQDRFISIQ